MVTGLKRVVSESAETKSAEEQELTRRVLRDSDRLSHRLGESTSPREYLGGGLKRRNELHQLHHGYRVDCERGGVSSASGLSITRWAGSEAGVEVLGLGEVASDDGNSSQKWKPTQWEARSGPQAAAILLREMLDVLLARMAPAGRALAREAKIFSLSGSDSETASMAMLTSPNASIPLTDLSLLLAASASSCDSLPFCTSLASSVSANLSPLASCASELSASSTSTLAVCKRARLAGFSVAE